jgi:hypothetical protein
VLRPDVGIGVHRRHEHRAASARRISGLGSSVSELLAEHHTQQLAARLAAGLVWQDNDLIFCKDDGTPWKPDYVSGGFKLLAKAAGLPVIKLHEGSAPAPS